MIKMHNNRHPINCELFWIAEYRGSWFSPQPCVDLVVLVKRSNRIIVGDEWKMNDYMYMMVTQYMSCRSAAMDTLAKGLAKKYPVGVPSPDKFSTCQSQGSYIGASMDCLERFEKMLMRYLNERNQT